jgi:hypothetical protein
MSLAAPVVSDCSRRAKDTTDKGHGDETRPERRVEVALGIGKPHQRNQAARRPAENDPDQASFVTRRMGNKNPLVSTANLSLGLEQC